MRERVAAVVAGLVFILTATARADTIKGELHVARGGETVRVDLSVLRDLFGVKKANDIKVQYRIAGRHKKENCALAEVKQCLQGANDWTLEIADVRTADDRMDVLASENKIEITVGRQVIEVVIKTADKSWMGVKTYEWGKDDLVQVAWWVIRSEDEPNVDCPKKYAVGKKGDTIHINGHPVAGLKKLLCTDRSAFTLAAGKDLGNELAAAKPGGATPEDLFKNMSDAVDRKDWKAFFFCIDPEKAGDYLGWMLLGFGFETAQNKEVEKDMKEVLKKHGIDDKSKSEDQLKDLKDKAAFFADFMNVMIKHGKAAELERGTKGAVLKDVTIDGNAAKGTVVQEGKSSETRFVKRGDRWYMAVETE